MPSLAGAVTTLGLIASSVAAPVFNSEYQTIPRPYTVTFTQQGLNAGPVVRHTDYTGKSGLTTVTFDVSDTALLSATEDPIDSQEIASSDVARLSVTEVTQLLKYVAVSDTASIVTSESIALVIAGIADKPVTDTASLSASDASVLDITVDVSDTASLSADDVSAVEILAEQVVVTDTATLSATEDQFLAIFAGLNSVNTDDIALLRVTDTASVFEVGRITHIDFEVTHWHIEMEIT